MIAKNKTYYETKKIEGLAFQILCSLVVGEVVPDETSKQDKVRRSFEYAIEFLKQVTENKNNNNKKHNFTT